jgi:hypothetical protein
MQLYPRDDRPLHSEWNRSDLSQPRTTKDFAASSITLATATGRQFLATCPVNSPFDNAETVGAIISTIRNPWVYQQTLRYYEKPCTIMNNTYSFDITGVNSNGDGSLEYTMTI